MDDRERLEGLARNLRSAWRAHHMGISLSTAHKHYHAGEIEEEIWYELAIVLDERWQRIMEQMLRREPTAPDTSQPPNEAGEG